MQIAIVQFPGSNCERETMLAVKRVGMTPVEFLWNESKTKLAECAGYIIVGGFSYEDRSRAGVIAALDPMMQVIKAESQKGKPVLGICNGAQILVESGLVPGVENNKLSMALTDNIRVKEGKVLGTGYYNEWVYMRLSDEYQLNAFTRKLTQKDILRIPVAHGEGRFVIAPGLLTEMQAHGLNVFQYCDAQGNIIDEFPINPNGSINNIAAVSNKAGNVMAMMPHPERVAHCDAIFESMRDYLNEGYNASVTSLNYFPRPEKITQYQAKSRELIIDLIITDNQALSVENALNHAGIPVKIKRQVHWEIACDSEDTFEKIKASGVLFNDRKEFILPLPERSTRSEKGEGFETFLVRSKDDMIGKQKQQMLEDHFGVKGIHSIQHGILWSIEANNDVEKNIDSVINSHILFNPYAHDYYRY